MSAEHNEWFEYPVASAQAYRRERGSLRYFPQYALMELLRQAHVITALTWLHLASVDGHTKRRVAVHERWVSPSPRPSRDPLHTARRGEAWDIMRRQMGPAFNKLQEAIVRARFVGAYHGEPDLFCWAPGGWFFPEAKRPGEKVLASQRPWWRIVNNCLGKDCRMFTCRLVPQGELPADRAAHSARWKSGPQDANAVRCARISGGLRQEGFGRRRSA